MLNLILAACLIIHIGSQKRSPTAVELCNIMPLHQQMFEQYFEEACILRLKETYSTRRLFGDLWGGLI